MNTPAVCEKLVCEREEKPHGIAVPGEPADQCALSTKLELAPGVDAPGDVLAPLQAYLAGQVTRNPVHFRQAFLRSAHLEGLERGRFRSWTFSDYCRLLAGTPATDPAVGRCRLESVNLSGTVGTAELTFWHGPGTVTHMLLLLRIDDGWRIANQVHHRHWENRRPRRSARPVPAPPITVEA